MLPAEYSHNARRLGWNSNLKSTAGEWQSFLDDFQQALDKFAVPAEEQAELKPIVDSSARADIVIDSALGAGADS